MYRSIQLLLFVLFFISCNEDEKHTPIPDIQNTEFVSAVDISSYPEIAATQALFYDLEGFNRLDGIGFLC